MSVFDPSKQNNPKDLGQEQNVRVCSVAGSPSFGGLRFQGLNLAQHLCPGLPALAISQGSLRQGESGADRSRPDKDLAR